MLKPLFAFLFSALLVPAAMAQQPEQPDPKELEQIFACMSSGLPPNWKKTWVVVTETSSSAGTRNFEAKFFFATAASDNTGRPLKPCDERQVAESVYALNKYLPTFDQRQWKSAKLQFGDDGSFNLSYDYTR